MREFRCSTCSNLLPVPHRPFFCAAPLPLQQLQFWQLWLWLRSDREAEKQEGSRVRWTVLPGEFITAEDGYSHINGRPWFFFPFTFQHGRESKGSHIKSPLYKSSDFDKYSDYSDDKYEYDEEGDDYDDVMCDYPQSKDSLSQSQGRGRHAKEQMKRGNMRGMKQQQCMTAFHIQTLSLCRLTSPDMNVFCGFWFSHSLLQLDRGEGAGVVDQEEEGGCSTRTKRWGASRGPDVGEVVEETSAWMMLLPWVCLREPNGIQGLALPSDALVLVIFVFRCKGNRLVIYLTRWLTRNLFSVLRHRKEKVLVSRRKG